MKRIMTTALIMLSIHFTMQAQDNCITLSKTTFEKGKGMCFHPDSKNVKNSTAKAKLTNNCSYKIVVDMQYDGEMNTNDFTGSPLKKWINAGESYVFEACFVKENKGKWKVKNVKQAN